MSPQPSPTNAAGAPGGDLDVRYSLLACRVSEMITLFLHVQVPTSPRLGRGRSKAHSMPVRPDNMEEDDDE
jgi:hypothetical protein